MMPPSSSRSAACQDASIVPRRSTRSSMSSFSSMDIAAFAPTGANAALSIGEKLDMLLRVDLRGTMLASWQAADLLEDGGIIINMSWDHVLTGMQGTNPQMYSAVKGGILAFSKSLARSVAPRVRVNVLAPGWIATAFSGEMETAAHRAAAESTPMKRWGT